MRYLSASAAITGAIGSLLGLGCQSSTPASDLSPSTVTATIDDKSWVGATVTVSYDAGTGIFRLDAERPGDSTATQLKLLLVNVHQLGTYVMNDTTGSEQVTPANGSTWGTATGQDDCAYDCFGLPTWGSVTITQMDLDRVKGSFTINPHPHSTTGTFSILVR